MRAAGALLGRRARLRWVHLILGGALLMPYWLLGTIVVAPFVDGAGMFSNSLAVQFGAYGVALPLAAVTALFPLARPMSVAVARTLCGVPAERFADGPARSRAARGRTAGWVTLHVGLGGLVSGASLALPPFAVTVMLLPFSGALREAATDAFGWLDQRWLVYGGVPAGLAMLVALAAAAAGAGALLARQAPLLLGPTPADKLAAAERRAAELAVRNRLARELHDSVGHALSAVTLQAGAARTVLDSDPAFVREALAAIEETTRRTVGELDAVLGLLRQGEDDGDLPGRPGLEALDALLTATGRHVSLTVRGGDMAGVPEPVSREAYRIVQEGLANAARHAAGERVAVALGRDGDALEITVENPLPARPPVARPGGGRGLRGVGERARLLGGTAAARPVDGVWRLTARLPLKGEAR
ncbi:histidine kinase [Streptomyces sp. WAC05374]|uniref:sensor histidine kinase n=1 Tax=Streptomyces sp. WAC05374 TaxID=2487420 RepID=UPI000F868DD3|nr:histidine kinase [Streptomyces sp. WAC05374]RST14132.1 histidine kinase [Streptomyces sp. WAC05374]TDF48308.1 histidine kinase [Streptomyces sp. WAC05374]TDF49239.1 histidine kinase [Streptomyces sp. WAC05374]TDF55241.1 histidine kinase [Streptomyces sp. WAC05374]